MKSCLIITVYENRCTNLINWLESPKSWIKEKVDIFLLVQENDPYKDEYKSLCNHINIIYCNVKNICEKRKYGYHWAIDNGYDVLIWTDDDINPVAKYLDFKTKSSTGNSYKKLNIEIDSLYLKLLGLIEKYPDGGVYTSMRPGYLGFQTKYQEIPNIDHPVYPVQLCAINLNNTKDIIDYPSSDKEYFEDQAFAIDCLINGMHIYSIPNFTFLSIKSYNWNKNTSMVFSDELGGKYKFERFLIGQYNKYGGDLYLNKKGILTSKLKYAKYFNNNNIPIPFSKEFDEELRKICSEEKVTNETVDKVYEYLKSKKGA